MKHQNPIVARQQGLTLVELMVAIVLSIIIIGAVITLYLSSSRTYRVDNNIAGIQDNARYALTALDRDFRLTGYEGCLTGHVLLHNDLNPGGSAYSFGSPFVAPLTGYQNVGGTWTPPLDASITSAAAAQGLVLDPNSDIITIQRADSNAAAGVTAPSGSSATLLTSTPNPYYPGEILVVTNCQSADVFQVTNANPNAGPVVHNSGASPPIGNATSKLSTNYGTEGEVMPLSTITYFVATPPASATNPAPQPTLWRLDATNWGPGNTTGPVPTPVITGVTRMLLFYGEDTDQDGAANEYLTAAQAQGVDPKMQKVVSLRVVLLLQSADNALARTAQSIPLFPVITMGRYTTAFQATDTRAYRIFTNTIAIRNRTP